MRGVHALPSRERLLQVLKKRSEIFQTTFNPENKRIGERYLTEPLKGPKLIQYYAPEFSNVKYSVSQINEATGTDFYDYQQEKRDYWHQSRKLKGKSTPVKKKEPSKKKQK